MSHALTRTHGGKSNRASEQVRLERKAVFKSVLDNPFEVKWFVAAHSTINWLMSYDLGPT